MQPLPSLLACCLLLGPALQAAEADAIFHRGNIITANPQAPVADAMAISGNRILAVGPASAVLEHRGPNTRLVDLAGKTVLPGLIDSHVHPGAAMTEFDHPIPEMESIADVLEYIETRTRALPPGAWIEVRQVFITRLKEQRYPTRAELDRAAPNHPVVFSTGPDASLNTLALKASGIDRDFKVNDGGPGHVETDPSTGEPTGILRSCARFVKSRSSGRTASESEIDDRTAALFRDYNRAGLTTVSDRSANPVSLERYQRLLAQNRLPLRLFAAHGIETLGPLEDIQNRIRAVSHHPLARPHPRLQIIGIKTFLDGGMLTGSAYMREPWGVSSIYAITDPAYRGVLFIPKDRLLPIVRAALENGLQFTAHSVGDGAVHALLEVYEEINRTLPVASRRPCITHSNFMSREAIERLAKLGAVADIQPAWLFLDAHTLLAQFGDQRLRYFQPLRSLFEAGAVAGGGSDHMQKIGSFRSVNPYNPFLGIWVAITRRSQRLDRPLHPEESLTRQQAIQFYTRNNAWLLFKEKEIGSLEPGKFADFIVVDRDLLTCPADDIPQTKVLQTFLDGIELPTREIQN